MGGHAAGQEGPDTIEYKIGEIFGEIQNKFRSGYSLRDALELIDDLRFRSQAEKHELSHLYEAKIKNMGNAGRNGGEYYTPRPLIRAMIKVIDPKIGETIYDGAAGSAGFLCESYDYLYARKPLTRAERAENHKPTFLPLYDPKLQIFLDFVLAQYVSQGVGELDQEKLSHLLELKYHTVNDAADQLGGIPAIRDAFVGFQKYLYE